MIDPAPIASTVLRRQLAGIDVTFHDARYMRFRHSWVVNRLLVKWQDRLLSSGAKYRAEVWDCDKYANAFKTFAQESCMLNPQARCSGAVGFMSIEQIGDTPPHAKNLILTDAGWYEVEPQNSTITPLRADISTIRHVDI